MNVIKIKEMMAVRKESDTLLFCYRDECTHANVSICGTYKVFELY